MLSIIKQAKIPKFNKNGRRISKHQRQCMLLARRRKRIQEIRKIHKRLKYHLGADYEKFVNPTIDIRKIINLENL